ncbi:type VI secretion system tip protein TssI/VgrG [Variovorax paradoxus]|uniref:Putative deoxyribonuclease RhsC n=1 Tax=Variovorax paradoxus TaxID=34073 RepID=A0A0H2LRL4_VARPD|nr:type VI secretion system tip protein TssI/VgrG [Variovorax paradoxus]KLN52898.1 putative deoxyribonuclease RhsC [Variovorax paradoxus]
MPTGTAQLARVLSVSAPAMPTLGGEPALEPIAIEGDEGLSALYRYTLTLATPEQPGYNERQAANVAIKQLIGEPLTAHIVLDGRPGAGPDQRHVSGLVTRVRFLRLENRRALYEAVVEPWLTLATRTSDYRIFQSEDVLGIVKTVLGKYGLPFEVRATRSYPSREFQVQYGESDFDFMARLLHEWGLYYYFEHEESSHKLIVVDDMALHEPFTHAGYQTVPFHPADATVREEHCDRFNACEELQSGQWVTDDFDFKRPNAELQQISAMPRKTSQATWERYDWPGDYVIESEGEQLVRTRMEETGSQGERASGSGNLRAVVPGYLLTLERHPQNESNRQYLVTNTHLRLQDVGDASSQQEFECRVDFEVIPTSKVFRAPAPPVPRPRTTGPQTAIVTGPAGREIWTDEYGRVKLSFHWNRYCTKDENSSCWIRVSSPWAGTNFGGIQLPRIGQEVIVDFENGDPDRPIVTGRVYNADNMPPWTLPGNATQSGLLTRSSEGGNDTNANALRFEDKKGQEQVWLHAERNQDIEVEKDETHWVGHDRTKTIDHDETVLVKHDRTETVDHDETITVHNDRHERVDQDEDVSIGGYQDLKVEKSKTENIYMFSVQNVGMARLENVGLAYNRNVGGGMLGTVLLGRTDIVGKTWTKSVGENYDIGVTDKYTLTCGKSSFSMSKDGDISLTGVNLRLNGKTLIELIGGGGSYTEWLASGITHGTQGPARTYAASHDFLGPNSKAADKGPARQDCQECKNGAPTGSGGSISFARGTERITHTDFVLQAGLPIQWSRRYHSALTAYDDGELGARWITPYTVCLQAIDAGDGQSAQQTHALRYHAADGRSHDYPLPAIGDTHCDAVEELVLRRTGLTVLTIERGPDWREVFELAGTGWRLSGYQTSQGHRIELRYIRAEPTPMRSGDIIPERPDGHALPPPAFLPTERLSDILSYQGAEVMAHAQVHWEHGRIGALWEVTDDQPTRQLASYSYDDAGDLVRAADANALTLENSGQAAWHYSYHRHLLTRYTDRTGRGMNLQWEEPAGQTEGGAQPPRAVREWADDGSFDTRLSWAPDSGAVTVVDALGHITVHHVDSLGFTTQIDRPDGTQERLVRDTAENVVEHHHPDGSIEHFSYATRTDGQSRLIEHLRADGSRIGYDWDAQGRLSRILDPQGGSWRRSYTAAGLLASQVDALGRVTRYIYNEKQQLAQIVDPKGASKKLGYTDRGQLASYSDCSGFVTRWSYDDQGRQQSETDAAGRKTQYVYQNGQLAAIVRPGDTEARQQHDGEGRLLVHTDPLGRRTEYRYNQAGLIQERIYGMQSGDAGVLARHGRQTLRYEWDRLGRLSSLINENGARHSFAYDVMGRLVEERGFDGQVTRYRHGPRTVMQQTADWNLRFEYDPMGRLLRRSAQQLGTAGGNLGAMGEEEVETFQYDLAGRRISARNSASRMQWFFDPVGNLVREHQHYDFLHESHCKVWQHTFDELDERVSTIRPDGQHQQWLTYGSGHVHGLMLDGQELVGFERDGLHREVIRIQGNGLTQRCSYDPLGRLTSQQWGLTVNETGESGTQGGHRIVSASTTTTPIIWRKYEYDPAGQLQTIQDSRRGALGYRYDPLGRLIEANSTLGQERFEFDPASNLLHISTGADTKASAATRKPSQPVLMDNLLRQFRAGPEERRHEHDERGNSIRIKTTGQSDMLLRWDGFGRLASVGKADGSLVTYRYDALGRRIGKYSDAAIRPAFRSSSPWHGEAQRDRGTTLYAWDGNTLAWESNAQEIVDYIYEPGKFVPMMLISKKPGQLAEAAQMAWYQCDHLGTPMELTDAGGKVVWSASYRAFGEARMGKAEARTNNIRFQGQYFDEESGLHYNRHRYYDPQTGRYLSKDPIGLAGGLNPFAYAEGNPNYWTDPMGLDPWAQEMTKTFGIGIEANNPKAYADGVHYVMDDPGHTVAYLRDSSGKITCQLSVGPANPIGMSNVKSFRGGKIPAVTNWPAGETVRAFEYKISDPLYESCLKKCESEKKAKKAYTPEYQCTSAALALAKACGIGLPSGVGKVDTRIPFGSGDYANPYKLNDQMSRIKPPQIFPPGEFK